MKGEYLQDKDHQHHQHPNSIMFSKLHQTHKFHPNPNPNPNPNPYQASEEQDSRRSPVTALLGDGATIEVVRRPRGRPPGSKNRQKPPVIITREPEPSMSPYILELSGGNDIVESVTRFCRKRNTGLCIFSGSGAVINVTLRQPSTTPGATVTFHGRFDILSLSSTILPVTAGSMVPPTSTANGCFTISLGGPQGQIVGGIVVGPLLAAGTVYLIAASFNNPVFQRLPMDQDVRDSGGSGNDGQSQSAVSGGGEDGLSVYGSHMGSDVIWGTAAARQPPPPPPHY
ncbi:AT-hook motif nuclear-localized protein 28-like [Impatiens glandulifera]|uniref:AT-hook motif nuclear-localized protein 28-like n=1 Tax=Impatiens glandulifera TaxID=253017 RepID=UPI001FB130B9|nr:AT-hook motif nuclear-localized protein 28-like [Impatiens glandulifera]